MVAMPTQARRTILVVLDTFLYSYPGWRYTSFVFYCLFLLQVQVFVTPFKDSIENRLETISLLTLVIIAVLLTGLSFAAVSGLTQSGSKQPPRFPSLV